MSGTLDKKKRGCLECVTKFKIVTIHPPRCLKMSPNSRYKIGEHPCFNVTAEWINFASVYPLTRSIPSPSPPPTHCGFRTLSYLATVLSQGYYDDLARVLTFTYRFHKPQSHASVVTVGEALAQVAQGFLPFVRLLSSKMYAIAAVHCQTGIFKKAKSLPCQC